MRRFHGKYPPEIQGLSRGEFPWVTRRPRPGGPLALLEPNPCADAVFCAHTGLESTVSIGQLWRGDLVNSRVRVKFWKVPYEDIPTGKEALTDWLWDQWVQVNAFVEETVTADDSLSTAHPLSVQQKIPS